MAEVDYQMALLLQHKFDKQSKSGKTEDRDFALAICLQEQFTKEDEIEAPKNNLVLKPSTLNKSKCLVDPSWEVIDPTPDVHVLFLAFNQRFFWNKLLAVTVSWSKRMWSCAGVCSYQGQAGYCSITLSEPLLKLRPRKDLVETLLHEMIHAYLFVTNNNKDRNGHGPEFHKHMYRINADAGTNITVYHDFHDEVRSYQQHWWRCNGPCQNTYPYYGFIQRATNRAPGPNDRWWSSHAKNCGGQFIKVKSPELKLKTKKGSKSPKSKKPLNDIRKYISSIGGGKVPDKAVDFTKPENNGQPLKTNNVASLSNLTRSSSSPQIKKAIPSTNNIFGFSGLNRNTSTPRKSTAQAGSSKVKGATKNAGSRTFEATKTILSEKTESVNTSLQDFKAQTQAFTGTGHTLSTSVVASNSNYSVVREHWLKKYGAPDKGSKRASNDVLQSPPKVAKLSVPVCENKESDKVDCPVCQEKVVASLLNNHLDSCLISIEKNTKECIICGECIPVAEYEVHIPVCTDKHFSDNIEEKSPLVQEEPKKCPVCTANLTSLTYDHHVEQCLLKMYDLMDEKYGFNKDTRTPCLVCNKLILKSEVNSHLEECTELNNTIDSSSGSIGEDEDEEDGKFNCPFCFAALPNSEMQNHVQSCFQNECDKDDSFIIESLMGDYDSD